VAGFWDYPLARRGLLYAPVAFDMPLWRSPGWTYAPRWAVNLSTVSGALSVSASVGQYYFGISGGGGGRLGLQPWSAYVTRRFDPLYMYSNWSSRAAPGLGYAAVR